MMFSVMDLHRLRIDMRLERAEVVRKRRKRKSHFTLLVKFYCRRFGHRPSAVGRRLVISGQLADGRWPTADSRLCLHHEIMPGKIEMNTTMITTISMCSSIPGMYRP